MATWGRYRTGHSTSCPGVGGRRGGQGPSGTRTVCQLWRSSHWDRATHTRRHVLDGSVTDVGIDFVVHAIPRCVGEVGNQPPLAVLFLFGMTPNILTWIDLNPLRSTNGPSMRPSSNSFLRYSDIDSGCCVAETCSTRHLLGVWAVRTQS